MSEGSSTILGSASQLLGSTEPALKLLLSILAGYPIAFIHRKYFYGQQANVQHLYFIATGILLGYLNYGLQFFHAIFSVIFSYLTLVIFRGSEVCVAITFIFNMSYLLIGYYYCSTDDYDINWTLPHCVLVLRIIGLSYDLYDGNKPKESLSKKNLEVVLEKRPTILEYLAHMFFPTSFLIGPQFPMRRYQAFIAKEYSSKIDISKPPECVPAGVSRLLLGVLYLVIFQVGSAFVSDDYMLSEEFSEQSFIKRCFYLGLWGRFSLYKYIFCWLLTEGACIIMGLGYNGKDENGEIRWDGLANVDISKFENSTEFNHYIQSFNTNTNNWVAQYIYKRLKFAGNKFVSQGATLFFLAAWHGLHSGYYFCFFFEFMVMLLEKDVHDIISKNPHVLSLFSSKPMQILRYTLLRCYTFVFMGWCMIPFVMLSFDKYWKVYKSVNFIGAIFFLPWIVAYGPIVRYLIKKTRPKERVE